MSVFWRSWGTVVILVAIVLVVLAALTTLQFNSTLSRFIQGRLAVLAQTSQVSFSAVVALGLPLSTVRNAPAILERARQTDPQIAAIHVFEPAGRILHSTDPDHLTSVPAEGGSGEVHLFFSVMKRSEVAAYMALVQGHHPDAFSSIEEVRAVERGVFRVASPALGVRGLRPWRVSKE